MAIKYCLKKGETLDNYKRIMILLLTGIFLWISSGSTLAATPKQIYQTAGPSVVFVLAAEGSQKGNVGTGSIIRKDGLVLTNAHIFKRKGSSRLKSDINVFLKPQRVTGDHKKDLSRRYRGKILAYDMPLDLALLQIKGLNTLVSTIEFADSQMVDIGDQVYAIGHPEQGGLWSLTTGVISAFRRDFGGVRGKNLFQTDASINRGNSGGPLLDTNGYMVGINSMIARKAADGMTITDVNYSIMSDVAIGWLAGLGYRFEPVKVAAVEDRGDVDEVAEPVQRDTPVLLEAEKQQPQQSRPDEKDQVPAVPVKPDNTPSTTAPATPAEALPHAEPKTPEKPMTKDTGIPGDSKTKSTSPSEEFAKEKSPSPESDNGRILTEKKPYDVSQLVRDMQEMEDMMEEMRGKIKSFKHKN